MAKEVRGADVLLKIGGVAVAGQRDASLSMQGDKIDTTTKTNAGWKTSLQGLKEWSISLEAVNYYGEIAASQRALKKAFINAENIQVVLAFGEEEVYMGEASITSLNMSGPMADVSTASLTLDGASELTCEFAPILSSFSLNSAKTTVTMNFDGNLALNIEGDVKSAISIAADGETYEALGESDSASISGKVLTITFSSALSGADNKIKIASGTFKTPHGAIQSAPVIAAVSAA